jgi:diguanylate cyclase (GGDEF)-like protein
MSVFNPEDFNILIIDDSFSSVELIIAILKQVNYKTIPTYNAIEALTQLEKHPPSLILLDLMMPEIDGLELCELIKSYPEYREIPIIFLTASHNENHILNAFGKGAVDYITKPYQYTEVLARVKTHLQLKQATDNLKVLLKEKEILIDKLETLATTDFLTNIFNRRKIFTLGEEEFTRSNRYKKSFSVLVLDIDYFKRINDTYGHPEGDKVLITVTKNIQHLIREIDYFGRVGGEEFMIILPETDLNNSKLIAERIRKYISLLKITLLDTEISITITLGISVYNDHDKSFDMMFKRADLALYQGKQNGRNQVCIA